MNSQIIELIGYIGSFLVLVSFLMTSVFKLRIVNTIGSLIFMIYALIIKSYPTAIMNFCLVLINVHFLWKMSHTKKEFTLVESNINDKFYQYYLDHYKEDILKFFPDQSFSFSENDNVYFVCHNANPVGLTIGRKNDDTLDLLLDYSIPEYRDFSIGSFLFSELANHNISKVIYRGSTQNHMDYLNKLNFVKKDDHYEKYL